MAHENDSLILAEIRGLRDDFNNFAREMEGRVSTLEAHDHHLMGNGQPGVIAGIQKTIGGLSQFKWKVVGMCSGATSVIVVLAWLIEHTK